MVMADRRDATCIVQYRARSGSARGVTYRRRTVIDVEMLAHQEIVLRLMLAAVLGGVVGIERERLEWVAGLRSQMLVCLGSALVMIVSTYGFADALGSEHVVLDPSRVAAQVVSGVGFLGAGTILFLRHQIIRGLTTAASLWTVAAIGLAAGGGLFVAAIFATGLVIVILAVIKPLENRLFRRDRTRHVIVHVVRDTAMLARIEAALDASGLELRAITLKRGDGPDQDTVELTLLRGIPKPAIHGLAARLQAIEGVRTVEL
jgi:putative Mg2+ transporter-C (MgtC) family protein